MNTKRIFTAIRPLILCVLAGSLVMSGCGPGQIVSPTITPTLTPTNTPTSTPTRTPTPTPDPYTTWSTNFKDLTDLNASEIQLWDGTQLSIDTTNVNSGGKSIKTSGPLNNQHMLQTALNIHGLIGRESIDLSDKTLSIEMFVPNGSPLPLLTINLGSGNNHMTVRANIAPQKGRWYTYEVDLNMVIALGSWQYSDWMHSPGMSTSADAVNLLKNVNYILIIGNNTIQATNVYFLIDKLGWKPSGAIPAYDPSADSLRKYATARNLMIDSYMGVNFSSDPQFMRIILQEFTGESSTESIWWPPTEPAGDNFDAAAKVPSDIFMENVAGRLGSPLVRYLVYDHLPDWLLAKSYDETKTILENYVRAHVSHYKGKTKIWFVFNELLQYSIGWTPYSGLGLKDRNETSTSWWNNYSPFSNSTSDVTQIEDAFRTARVADPNALLFLNEGTVEEMGQPRADAYYNLVAKLVHDGTPIDGLGLQAHLMITKDGTVVENDNRYIAMAFNSTDGLTNVAKNVERYQKLGLKVVFSEVDVPIYMADIDSTQAGQQKLAQRLQLQAEVYRSLMHITLTHSNMPAFILQSWADQYSWTQEASWSSVFGDLGIYDVDYQPKPAYYALLDELKGP